MNDNAQSPAAPRWLIPGDELVLRLLFAAMLAATGAVLYIDYNDFSAVQAARAPLEQPAGDPAPRSAPMGDKREKMTFELVRDGRLIATGSIAPGSARTFAAEIDERGAYVKTVVLTSAGGSVQDAMEMGRLIRAKNIATEVEPGHICASSCPLVFAGGTTRKAAPKAELGVHQMVALGPRPLNQNEAMADAQRISAQVQGYLKEMGVDLGLWVRAMETPNTRLYNLTPAEMLEFKLATEVDGKTTEPRAKTRS